MRPLALALLAILTLAPMVQAHGLPGVPVATGTPPGVHPGSASQVPAAFQPLSLAAEAGVGLQAVPRGDGSNWAAAPETGYDLQFVCPSQVEQADASAAPAACPSYVLDVEDVMAQPVLVVDPRQPTDIAFNALHGGPGVRAATQDPLPTARSRSDLIHQPHTTFQSDDGGAYWDDNRYYPPEALMSSKSEVFGEDNGMAASAAGDLTIASLYSFYNRSEAQPSVPLPPTPVHPPVGQPVASGNTPGYAVAIWSSGRAKDTVDYHKGLVVLTAPEGDALDTVQVGSFPAAKAMVVAWRESNATASWLTLVHRGADGTGQWEPIPQVAGACSAITNAIQVRDRLLIGCVQGHGRGDLHLFAVHADWTVEDLGRTPVRSVDGATLASAESVAAGGFVLSGAGITEGRPHVWVAFAKLPEKGEPAYSRSRDYGDHLTTLLAHSGEPLLEARVTALAFMGTSATAHLLYMERYASQAASGPTAEYAKVYSAVQADGRFLGTWGVGYGDAQANANVPAIYAGTDTSVFDDLHDSIVVAKGKHGGERLFLAFGDHGFVRFAEVVEQQPPVVAFPPIGAPAAIPTLTAATSPVVVGTVAGALSLAAVSRLALARSKKAAEAPAP